MFSFGDFKIILVFLLLIALMYVSCDPSSIHRMNKKGKDKDGDSNNDVRDNSRAMM